MAYLAQAEIEVIHERSLTVLERVGVRVHHEPVRRLLLESGARPADGDELRVLIPRSLVEAALQACPGEVRIGDRRGNGPAVLRPGAPPLFWTGNALYRSDGKLRRELVSEDFAALVRLIDALDAVDGMVGTSLADYPSAARDFVGFRIMAENTRKHLRPCIYTARGAQLILEMGKVLAGGAPLGVNPIFSLGYSIVSPLQWSATALELMQVSSGHGLPFMINSEPLAGGTTPVTLAGCLVVANADALSGVVITQLLEEGRPVIFNLGFAHVLDMSSGVALTGAPECALLQGAGAEIAAFHGLPSAGWMSTESCVADPQAAYEKMLVGLSHLWGGVNVIWGVGNLETTLTISPVQAVIDNEICSAIKRIAAGIEIGEETLACELIEQAGFAGDFLTSEHTRKHFRREIWHRRLPNRVKREVWESRGAPDLVERAQSVVAEKLNGSPEGCLTPEQASELLAIQRHGLRELLGGA